MKLDALHAALDKRLKGKPVVGRAWQWSQEHPRWAAAIAVFVLVLVTWLGGSVTRSNGVQRTYYTVKRGDFLISVVEGGTLRALNEFSVRSEVETMTKVIGIVPEGAYVKQGDLLVQLDSSQIKEGMDSQEITLENSRFSLLQAEQALAIQKSLAESNIKDAELKVEFAKSDLEKYIEGDWPQQKNDSESRITLIAEDLERAKDRQSWTQVLQQKGYATKSEMQADSLSVKQKEVSLAQAREARNLLMKYDYPKKRRSLEAYVESYEKELERLKQRSSGSIAQSEADLATRRRTLALQQERYDELKKQMALCTIKAPSDGLVVYSTGSGSYYSSVLIEEGASIRYRQEIIKLPNINQMVIEIRVHESHITRIRPGLPCYVTIDSMPDLRLKGHVHKVAVLPDSSSRYYNPTLKVYVTEVLIEDTLPTELKPGVSGRAEIVITNLHNVIAVPLQAVTSVKGEQVCFGKEGKSIPVEVGLYNDKFIEIRSGLKEGDNVLLAPLLAESDQINLSGSIVAPDEYEADRKGIAKKRKPTSKAGATQEKQRPPRPPTPLQTLQQPLNELRRAAQPLEPPLAAPKQRAANAAAQGAQPAPTKTTAPADNAPTRSP
jgi:multidrug resistance efflux pump